MNEDLDALRFVPIKDYKYSRLFGDIEYNERTLDNKGRKEVIDIIDERVANNNKGLSILDEASLIFNHQIGDFSSIYHIVISVMTFVLVTMNDSMVAGKYFLLADKDYDKRFMRGKLMVILNEGFKRLYGFNDQTHEKSEWDKLLPLMKHFPEPINHQYQELTILLEEHSKASSWWREERNIETHIDAVKLLKSRNVEIIESKVMMESLHLYEALHAVNMFLENAHSCLYNYMLDKFHKGELKDE